MLVAVMLFAACAPTEEAEAPSEDCEPVMHARTQGSDMDAIDGTAKVITQGQALVRAIEAMGTIEPSGLFERAIAGLLLAGYKRRLKAIIGLVPAWAGERILRASMRVDNQ